MMIKKVLTFLCSLFIVISIQAQTANELEVLRGMQDELDRTVKELQLPSVEKPCYIAYTINLSSYFQLEASLGTVTKCLVAEPTAMGGTRMFLGSYQSNSDGYYQNHVQAFSMSPELKYEDIRRCFWLSSDQVYKESIRNSYMKKKYLTNSPQPPEYAALPDFTPKDVSKPYFDQTQAIEIDQEYWKNIVKKISKIFAGYDEIYDSGVIMTCTSNKYYHLATDKTKYVTNESVVGLNFKATVKTAGKMALPKYKSIIATRPGELPSEEDLYRMAEEFAESMKTLATAGHIDASYNGPLLIMDDATTSLLSGLLAPQICTQRRSLGESNEIFEKNMGVRVIDPNLSLTNYTNMKDYKGQPVFGSYAIDAEGVLPQAETRLIERGILKAVLSNRVPTPQAKISTGSSRWALYNNQIIAYTAPSILHLSAKKTIPFDDMMKYYLKLLKKKGLTKGYVIKSVSGLASEFYEVNLNGDMKPVIIGNAQLSIDLLYNVNQVSTEEFIQPFTYRNAIVSTLITPKAFICDDFTMSKPTSPITSEFILSKP